MLQMIIAIMAAIQFLKIIGCMLDTLSQYESMQA